MNEPNDELQRALRQAADLVADLPEELKAVAFQEAFRALRAPVGERTAVATRDSSAASRADQLPDADLVAERGERVHKIAYAAARIAADGGVCTTGAIKAFLNQQLATKVKGNGVPDVLKANTPKFFQRQREGREFSYKLTDKGIAMLVEWGRTQLGQ